MNFEGYSVEEIGKFIKARRRQVKVTQRQLAMTANTGLRFISELERGKPTCQIGKVLIVLQTLGIKIILAIRDGK
ncbi:MAG: transcriptional regulator [Verrucomicrobia bacterium]|nr:MAG: transcriptional regulator [Verrucomicrobiota bacterium]